MKRPQFFLVLSCALAWLGCDQLTGPAFYRGPATFSAVVADSLPDSVTLTVRHYINGGVDGVVEFVVEPGDSICHRFMADGDHVQEFVFEHGVVQTGYVGWTPSKSFPHMTLLGIGGGALKHYDRQLGCE